MLSELLKVSPTLYYYVPLVDRYNLELSRLIDELYMSNPCYGVERMTAVLRRMGHIVNVKRIRRLMRIMGIEAIYCKKSISVGNKAHKKYPYLLKDLAIDCPNQVWCADITYIPIRSGNMYLVAVGEMDG